MIQPIKKLHISSLTVQGFKGFAESRTFTFSDMNTITGHNGQGKTSIADAIAFAVTGVPFYGGARLDHLYHQDTRDISVPGALTRRSAENHPEAASTLLAREPFRETVTAGTVFSA